MESLRLIPPDERRARGERARLYVRWMPRLGAVAVALYELLRTLPDAGVDEIGSEEAAELLRSTPEEAEEALRALLDNGFLTHHGGWIEVHDLPPGAASGGRSERSGEPAPDERPEPEVPDTPETGEGGPPLPQREVEVIRAGPEGVSADDYFRYMGSLPAPHILEFLNGYCGRDGVEPDVVREALRIASERDARKVGYVRSIMERWVERGVKTAEDVELFEQDRRLRLVAEGGGHKEYGKTGRTDLGEGVSDGADRQSAAGFKEGYEWFFGE